MGTPFAVTVDLPVGVEQAWQALTGPGWPAALDARLHDGSRLVSAEPVADGGLVIAVSRELPDKVPSYLQRFVPSDGRVVQTDTWGPAVGGVRRGTWAVAMPSAAPAAIGGDLLLEPAGEASRWVVSGSVRVSVPLLGGRVESYLAPLLGQLVEAQGEVLVGMLSD